MEFWDGTRYIRHIRRGPSDLPTKTILALIAGGIAAAGWLWPAQHQAHLPVPAPAPCAPPSAVPAAVPSALGWLPPAGDGLTAGPPLLGTRPATLRPGTTAPATTSSPAPAAAAEPVATDAQPVVLAVTPSPSPSPTGKPKGKPKGKPTTIPSAGR